MRNRPLTGFLFAGIVLAAFPGMGRPAPPAPSGLEAHLIPGVPFFPQEENGCGPSSLASVLNYWGKAVSLEEMTEEVYLPGLKGALGIDLESAAQERGLSTSSYSGSLSDLLSSLERNQPVIAFLNLGLPQFPRGHFIVVTGFDRGGNYIIAHSGLIPNERIPVGAFLKSWAKTDFWTLAIRPGESGPGT